MNRYIPPETCPDETYWLALLEEGEYSHGKAPGPWAWVVAAGQSPSEVWQEAETLRCQRKPVELTIEGFNRGGLLAHWKGIECFVPASHLLAYPFPADQEAREARFQTYVGKTLRLCVIEVEPARNRLLLSERAQDCCMASPVWPDWLCPGRICEGMVTSLRSFGVFVNLGVVEGMIHISEISWGRVRDVSNVLKVGDTVRVLVLSVDQVHQRVALSLKRLMPNPWDSIQEKVRVGTVMDGTVVAVEPFGVFVQLLPDIEGLVHVSELGCEASQLPQRFKVGQPLRVEVLDLLPREHRIALRVAGVNGHGGA